MTISFTFVQGFCLGRPVAVCSFQYAFQAELGNEMKEFGMPAGPLPNGALTVRRPDFNDQSTDIKKRLKGGKIRCGSPLR